ncbi:MAG: SUMF1/EgtB/PvdO family nonheme iron enzyme [Planctomycetes bacterium]|nr:SUMF1/EgtB/PvdO family nonheme iron enzyme [Planctomycetota bacterium]
MSERPQVPDLASLPLPWGQTLRRAVNADSAEARHQAAYFFFESVLKLAAAAQVADYLGQDERDPKLAPLLGKLAHASAGHWLGVLRDLSAFLKDRSSALGGVNERATRRLRLPQTKAFLRFAAELNGQSEGRKTHSVLDLFDGLIAYRNREVGHGAQRARSLYERAGPLLLDATLEALESLDPLDGSSLAVARDSIDPRSGAVVRGYDVLLGNSLRVPFAGSLAPQQAPIAARSLVLIRDGLLLALPPLVMYAQDDLDRDCVGYLNGVTSKGKGEALTVKKAEFLDYNSGNRLEVPPSTLESLADLLRRLSVGTPDRTRAAATELGSPAAPVSGTRETRPEDAASTAKPAPTPVQPPAPVSSTGPLVPGVVLCDRYEIRGQLGEGGMGAVFAAYDRVRTEQIAIKVLLPSLAENEAALQRFLTEGRLSSRLSHPGVVNVFDVQKDGERVFLTMELLEGQTLRQVMEDKTEPFGIEEVTAIGSELCESMAYAHDYTVHRDIKPGNVWVCTSGRLKLMDFGIARTLGTGQHTKTGVTLGTAYYMAPEQVRGAKDLDHRADQYSLGVLLFELLTGEVPTGPGRPLRELRPDVPKALAQAVGRAREGSPERRYRDMREFKAALAAAATPKGGLGARSLALLGCGVAVAIAAMTYSSWGPRAAAFFETAAVDSTPVSVDPSRTRAEARLQEWSALAERMGVASEPEKIQAAKTAWESGVTLAKASRLSEAKAEFLLSNSHSDAAFLDALVSCKQRAERAQAEWTEVERGSTSGAPEALAEAGEGALRKGAARASAGAAGEAAHAFLDGERAFEAMSEGALQAEAKLAQEAYAAWKAITEPSPGSAAAAQEGEGALARARAAESQNRVAAIAAYQESTKCFNAALHGTPKAALEKLDLERKRFELAVKHFGLKPPQESLARVEDAAKRGQALADEKPGESVKALLEAAQGCRLLLSKGDTRPPEVRVTSKLRATREATITLTGVVRDARRVELRANGALVPLKPSASGTYTFEFKFEFSGTPKATIEFVAQDEGGIESRLKEQVVRDTTPPVLVQVEVPQGLVKAGNCTVKYKATDPAGPITISLAGQTKTARSGEVTSFELRLQGGPNRFEIRAEDAVGNHAEERFAVEAKRPLPSWFLQLREVDRPPLPLPSGLKPGPTPGEFIQLAAGYVLVWVPRGDFQMGSAEGDPDEAPVRRVRFASGYFLGKHEVSWRQYRAFCAATKHRIPQRGEFPASDEHPVFSVSLHDAKAYCAWGGLRLPSEAEWEYAARGPRGRKFPWGSRAPSATRLNLNGRERSGGEAWADPYRTTAPVRDLAQGASPFGCLNMAGNVWEWCADAYTPRYGQPVGDNVFLHHTIRGGSYYDTANGCRTTRRFAASQGLRFEALGFRAALSPRSLK